ncbi:hypothetical protein H105_04480 [Trichophyton soudanense CBS 452.61]|uniref:Uncharacterized protein n=1 Tax=Trichophyton soudanense CBS 452.61 TaxID=1215331 RepID=A0A022XSI1_TRISD|nr:hypothetical protein H105_04480 [Trichophyton soudanense CBS 452.61]
MIGSNFLRGYPWTTPVQLSCQSPEVSGAAYSISTCWLRLFFFFKHFTCCTTAESWNPRSRWVAGQAAIILRLQAFAAVRPPFSSRLSGRSEGPRSNANYSHSN